MSEKQKIYIDESGNNGIVKYNHESKTFDYDQRYFTLCLFMPTQDTNYYIEKYNKLRIKHGIDISIELKGSDIMTKKYNSFLIDFIEEFINDKEFYVTLYDKKFLVASFLVFNVFGEGHRIVEPKFHFAIIEMLTNQSDAFFEPFFLTCQTPTKENVEYFLKYLINYKYDDIRENEMVLSHFKLMLQNFLLFPNTAIKNITYEFENTSININMTSLGESLLVLKDMKKITANNHIEIYHDESIVVSEIIFDMIPNLNIKFVNSDKNIMVQIADNVASIFNKTQKEIMKKNYKNIKEIKNQWHFKHFSAVSRKVKPENIKYCFDLASGIYLQSFAFYNSNMSNLEYGMILHSLFSNSLKSLEDINFDLAHGMDILRE